RSRGEMTIHQSVKQTNLKERRQALYDLIRLLGIESLDINSSAYAEDLVKTTQNQISRVINSGLDQYSQITTPRVNKEIRDS
ncbi:hypothetical protein ACFLYR_04285, partial [Chloroflexota bacterium]